MKNVIKFLWTMWETSDNLGGRFVRGSSVLVIGRFLIKAIYFIKTIILARLLFPDDFGLFGIAAVALGTIDIFLQPGMYHALVYEKNDIKGYLDTVWVVHIVRNTVFAAIIFLVAPYLGVFFDNPDIVPLMRVLAFANMIVGFENPGVIYLQKELKFNKKFLLDFSTVATEVVVVIVAGFVLQNAWALVVGSLANRVAAVAYSYVASSYQPKFHFNKEAFLHLFGYAKWVSGGAVIGFLVSQGDNLSIAKLLTTTDLGYYQPAFALALLPIAEISRVLGNALFPYFGKLDQGREFLGSALVRVARVIFTFTVPASVGLMVTAPDIVRVLYGERWLPMVPIVVVLAFYSLARSFDAVAFPFFSGIGKPKMVTMATTVQCVVMFLFVFPLAMRYGVIGVAWSVLLGGVAAEVVLVGVMTYMKFTPPFSLLRVLVVPALGVGVMYFLVSVFQSFIEISSVGTLVAEVLLGGMAYVVAVYFFDKIYNGEIMRSIVWIKERGLSSTRTNIE